MKKQRDSRIAYTLDDGGVASGRFLDHPEWSFQAEVVDGIDWDYGCLAYDEGTSVRWVALYRRGIAEVCTIGDDVDRNITEEHLSLLAMIDEHFSLPPEDRERAVAERRAARKRIASRIRTFLSEEFGDEDPDLVLCALSSVRNGHS